MGYAIIGFGAVGQALARAFARQHIEVAVASRRPPDALPPQAQAIGSTDIPRTLRKAVALLVSGRGKFLTGVNYRVDGGMTAR